MGIHYEVLKPRRRINTTLGQTNSPDFIRDKEV